MFKRTVEPSTLEKSSRASTSPSLVSHRNATQDAAVIFVHGFTGDATSTWAQFVELVLKEDTFSAWDIYSVGYPTSLSLDFPVWTADPDIAVCAKELITYLRNTPLDRYKAIAMVAHSMGGLVVQKAVLDDEALRARTSHLLMFGTPSAGLAKAGFGSLFKKQAKDMRAEGPFIRGLREGWTRVFSKKTPFDFRTVAGDKDVFVPPSSSLNPFPTLVQDVVPGNHLSIIRPGSAESYSFQILKRMIAPGPFTRPSADTARLAVEQREFTRAVELLEPQFWGLDADGIVTLSLALQSLGQREKALSVLKQWDEAHPECDLDAKGTLAGQLKRQWLLTRQKADFDESLQLYSAALEEAEVGANHGQAHYHAINIAFLLLVSNAQAPPVAADVAAMAKKALDHAQYCIPDRWAFATIGEAHLMLGEVKKALESYGAASESAKTIREKDSMALQAISVAGRLCNDEENQSLRDLFRFSKS